MRENLWGDQSLASRFTLVPSDSRFSAELIVRLLIRLLQLVRVPEVPERDVDVKIALLRGALSTLSNILNC